MLQRHFILQHDSRYNTAIYIEQDLSDAIRLVNKGDYSAFKKSQVVTVQKRENMLFPDVLHVQLPLVRKWVLDVMELYQPGMPSHTLYLSVKTTKQIYTYYLPELQRIPCRLSLDKGTLFADQDVAMLDAFIAQCSGQNHIIVSLALAESILRRKPQYVQLKHVVVEKEDVQHA